MMAQICADVIIKNTGGGKTDHFWDSSELNLLKALILYVDYEKTPAERNIGAVYRMLSDLTENELNQRFEILQADIRQKHPTIFFSRQEIR